MTCEDVFAMQPPITGPDQQTSEEYADNFKPGSRTVTILYGRIPRYRTPRTKGWGFAISDKSATWAWFSQYTCPRKQAKKVYEDLAFAAAARGFVVKLVLEEGCGLNPDLTVAGI